jgi:predicted nucleotidyltransferase
MLDRDQILLYLQQNKENFHRLYGIQKIGLFGSFARNQQTEKSDVDIIIVMDSNTGNIFEKRLMLQELLMKAFSRQVDVCHEQAIKPVFRKIILKDTVYA